MVKITTPTGIRMLQSVSPGVYDSDEYVLSIFEANGKIMEEISQIIERLKYEIYPQNATWTIDYWEDMLGIDNNADRRPLHERVHRVLYELNKYSPVTRRRMEAIVNSFVADGSAKVYEYQRRYRFRVVIPLGAPFERGLFDAVEETKPAHLRAVYYIKIGDFLYYLNPEQRKLAPVLIYKMRIGEGKVVKIEWLMNASISTFLGKHRTTGRAKCGSKSSILFLGKRTAIDFVFYVGSILGINMNRNIKAKMIQDGNTENLRMKMLSDVNLGKYYPDFLKHRQQYFAKSNDCDIGLVTRNKTGLSAIKRCGNAKARKD